MKRALIALSVVVVLVLGALVVVPFFFKDRVLAVARQAASEASGMRIEIGEARLDLLGAFPNPRVVLRGVEVGPVDDPLLEAERVGLSLSLGSLLGGTPEVRGILLDKAVIHYVAAEGEDAAAEPSTLSLRLRGIQVNDLALRYEDPAQGLAVQVDGLDLSADVDVDGARSSSLVDLRARVVDVRQGGVPLLSKAKLRSSLDVVYDGATGRVELGQGRVVLNALAVGLSGTVQPQAAGTDLDLRFQAEQTAFKGLLSLIPAAYRGDFDAVDADGLLTLAGTVKGLLPADGDDLPAFDLTMAVQDGRFHYPQLPSSVTDIQLQVHAVHPGGPMARAAIDLSRFHLVIGGAPLDGHLALRHLGEDPDVDLAIKGAVDLGQLHDAFPDDEGADYTGTMDVDVTLAGRLSAFQSARVDDVTADGHFTLREVVYTDPEQPVPFTIDQLDLSVSPRSLDLATFRMRFPGSDLQATGKVENALGYMLTDEVLRGSFELRSRNLDLTPWAQEDEGESDESALVAVPTDLALALDLKLGRVLFPPYDLRDVRGRAAVKGGSVRLDGVRAETLGGAVRLDGTYTARTERQAKVDMRIRADGLDAADTVQTFASAERVLPLMRSARGEWKSDMQLRTTLHGDLAPDLPTLFSRGVLGAMGLTIAPPFLDAVARYVGNDRFKSMQLDGRDLSYTVDGGKLKMKAVPVKIGGARGSLRGSTGVMDDALDLTLSLDVPVGRIKGGEALAALGAGASGTVSLTAGIGGTWSHPKVKIDMKDLAKAAAVGAVAAVAGQVDVDQARQAASEEADRIIAEARKQAKKIKAAARKKANQLIKAAEGNPIAEKAAKKAADKVIKAADKKAAAIIAAAEKKAAAL